MRALSLSRSHALTLRSGLTLMESLVVIGIMGAVLITVTQIFASNYNVFFKQMARTDNDTGAILAVRQLSEMARGASSVVASYTINGTLYTSSSTTLVLQLPSRDASGNILPGTFDYIAFYRDGTTPAKIFADTAPGTGSSRPSGKRLVTNYNDTLTFRYNADDITTADRVSLYLINSQTVRGAKFVTKAWTSLFLRNFAL